MINPIGNNVSFNGIVQIKDVFIDGKPAATRRTYNAALAKFRRILMKQSDTVEKKSKYDAIRSYYHFIDNDYLIPAEKVEGNTSSILTRMKAGFRNFFLTGEDAKKFNESGENIGSKSRLYREFSNGDGALLEGKYLEAKQDYGSIKDELSLKYDTNPLKPYIILFAHTDKKGKIVLDKVRMRPKYLPKQSLSQSRLSFFDTGKKSAIENLTTSTKPQKPVQTDFLDKLFG